MANIQHHIFLYNIGSIYGVAGYYSDKDSTQHVVAATTDGILHETHWNRNTSVTSPQPLRRSPESAPEQFNGIHSLSGFFTSDDRTSDPNTFESFQHVIVATEDGRLQEVYFTDLQHVHVRSSLYQLTTTAGPHIGMAGFSSSDGLRHATVGGADSILHEVVWSAQVTPTAQDLYTQFYLPDVAAITGFSFDLDIPHIGPHIHTRDVIVAMREGSVSDVYYRGGYITRDLLTTFSSPLANVAAFVNTDTSDAHVIVLHSSGQLYDYTYNIPSQGNGQTTPLVSIPNVVDIAAYYSAYDRTCHVIAATRDGNLHEVYYTL
jgi:hypothetical protein